MLKIKPEIKFTSNCPICNNEMTNKNITFTGMRTLISVSCNKCKETFYTDLPTGHGLYYSFYYSQTKNKIVNDKINGQWFAKSLENTIRNSLDIKVNIKSEEKSSSKLLILSVIDSYFGHSLLRLLTIQYYFRKNKNKDILLIIPKNLEWIVPKYIKNVIVCNVSGKNGDRWINGLSEIIQIFIDKYEEVFLASEYQHIYKSKNIDNFTGIKPNNPDVIMNNDKMCIGYIWREDRLWNKRTQLDIIFKKIEKVVGINLRRILIKQQYNNVKQLLLDIREKIPEAQFYVSGFGKFGEFPDFIEDLRTTSIDKDIEIKWIKKYLNTSLIIGLHGSNMILPSAYSAMTLDIMPEWKWNNVMEDIIIQTYSNQYDTLFRYRFIPKQTPVNIIADIAISMLIYYKKFKSKFNAYE